MFSPTRGERILLPGSGESHVQLAVRIQCDVKSEESVEDRGEQVGIAFARENTWDRRIERLLELMG